MPFPLRVLVLVALIGLPPVPFLWAGWDYVGSPRGFGAILVVLASYGAWIGVLAGLVQIIGIPWREWFTATPPPPPPAQPDLSPVSPQLPPTPINLTVNLQYMLIESRDVQGPVWRVSAAGGVDRTDVDYQQRTREAKSLPLTILIWGPDQSDPALYAKMVHIRHTLRLFGHDARFAEEWVAAADESNAYINRGERIQVEFVDWIIVMCSWFISVAEAHDIQNLNQHMLKLLILVDQEYIGSYGARALLENLELYNRVFKYTTEDFLRCSLMTRIMQEAEIRQIEKWDRIERSRRV